jgi:uncharacterized protein with ATP-grasp and redox domains
MKSWDREFQTHVDIIEKFLELADIPEKERHLLKLELRRYMTVRVKRGFWMQPEITQFHTEWYREFYRLIGGAQDPYLTLKQKSNEHMARILDSLTIQDLRQAILMAIVANKLDFGAVDYYQTGMPVELHDFENITNLPLLYDDFNLFLEKFSNAGRLLYITDNNGEVLVDRRVLQQMRTLNPQCDLYIAGKAAPMLNDVTVEELHALQFDALGHVISTGTNCFGVPEDEVSVEFLNILKSADVIVAKGQAQLEFWIAYDIPNVFNLAHIKFNIRDSVLGEIPKGCNVLLSSARYGHNKRPYNI